MLKGFEIVKAIDVNESLLKYREKGALRGKYLGFENLEEYYTMALPGCTDWTGFPGSGKSEFLLECLLNTSLFYSWKHLIYVPDVGDREEILAILIHKITGKTFDKRYQSNYITEKEVNRELDWVLEHFKILVKTEIKAKITPYELWDFAVEYSDSLQGGIQTVTVDSWKDLKHGVSYDGQTFQRDDKYLEDVLSYRNAISEKYKMHLHTVIHPTKTEADKDGKRRAPGPYDLKGGSEWYNNGKTMITVHRVAGTANEVEIMITKAKPKSVAKVGKVRMFFDIAQAKFYFMHNQERFYASKEKRNLIGVDLGSSDENDDVPF